MNYLVTTLAIVALGLVIAAMVGHLAGTLAHHVQRRRAVKRLRHAWDNRPRGRMVEVGTVTRIDGNWHIDGFKIDCSNGTVHHQLDPFTGELVIGGYTREELLEISQRKSEWS